MSQSGRSKKICQECAGVPLLQNFLHVCGGHVVSSKRGNLEIRNVLCPQKGSEEESLRVGCEQNMH